MRNKKGLNIITFLLDMLAIVALCVSMLYILLTATTLNHITIISFVIGITLTCISTLAYKRFK